jgi:D-sedoheptulose 7-phosphate isomerase
MNIKTFHESLEQSIDAKKSLLNKINLIKNVIDKLTTTLKNGNKILLCGNGGSAADAQHLAAEFLIRLRPKVNRKPFPVLSLATDTSTITACGNDYSFDEIFKRNFEAFYNKGDALIVISTSGNSNNILKILKYAKSKRALSIGFLGHNGGKAKKLCKYPIVVGSNKVARIQEAHIFLGHYIFENVENNLINR